MDKYTFENHINNMKLLKRMSKVIKVEKKEEYKFRLVNPLIDFIRKNQQYSFMQSFLKLSDSVEYVLELCNDEEHSESISNKKNEQISYEIINVIQEIINKYELHVYFIGEDEYRLFDSIINPNIKIIDTLKKISYSEYIFNILVIDKENCAEELDMYHFDKVIYYNKFIDDSFNLAMKIYNSQYDYNYLRYSLEKAKKANINGIVVGTSYSMYGIDESMLEGDVVNLSLASQDLYYSYKIAKNIISHNNNIKKCFIGTGFWSFYMDVSKSLDDGVPRIQNVYYPILLDSHNYEYEGNIKNQTLANYIDDEIKYIFNISKLDDRFNEFIFQGYETYFNTSRTKNNNNMLGMNKLVSMSLEDKLKVAKIRAGSHNELIKYKETKNENIFILTEFLEYLCNKNIKPIIINFATTRYYFKFISLEHITEYNEVISELSKKYKFEFIDLNNYDIFEDDDFVDMDHMSDKGTFKVNEVLNNIL